MTACTTTEQVWKIDAYAKDAIGTVGDGLRWHRLLDAELNYRMEMVETDAEIDALMGAYPMDDILLRIDDLPAASLPDVAAKIRHACRVFEEGKSPHDVEGALLSSAISDLYRLEGISKAATA